MLRHRFYISDDGAFLPPELTPTDGRGVMERIQADDPLNRDDAMLSVTRTLFRRQDFVAPSPHSLEYVRELAESIWLREHPRFEQESPVDK